MNRRDQDQPGTPERRHRQVAKIMDSRRIAWAFDNSESAQRRDIVQPPPFARLQRMKHQDAASRRQVSNRRPQGRIGRRIDDQPSPRGGLAAFPGRSYSDAR